MEGLYDSDFYQWTQENAQLLKAGRFLEADIENIVEELESMGRSERRAFISRLAVLIAHLMKWEYQPKIRSKSWQYTIRAQRSQVRDLLKDNPSFKLGRLNRASTVTRFSAPRFPAQCPPHLGSGGF